MLGTLSNVTMVSKCDLYAKNAEPRSSTFTTLSIAAYPVCFVKIIKSLFVVADV